MSQISIQINNVPYTVACDDGQESQVQDLAKYVDAKIVELKKSLGHVGEARLLVLAALKLADELAEAYAYIDKLEEQKAETLSPTTAQLAVSQIEGLVSSIESLASRLPNH
ncbi:MAG: cell division protein ZapA [Alphaproteobacteria bacterium]|nr:MAG: cell division protein ZapA [Alphaproteobacteria bacterium]